MPVFESEYNIKEVVYLRTDPAGFPRLITAIQFTTDGVRYRLSCADTDSWHFNFEITKERVAVNAG
jgi:hypothetical protein